MNNTTPDNWLCGQIGCCAATQSPDDGRFCEAHQPTRYGPLWEAMQKQDAGTTVTVTYDGMRYIGNAPDGRLLGSAELPDLVRKVQRRYGANATIVYRDRM